LQYLVVTCDVFAVGPEPPNEERERAPREGKRAESEAIADGHEIVGYGATRYHQQVTNAREFFVPRRAS